MVMLDKRMVHAVYCTVGWWCIQSKLNGDAACCVYPPPLCGSLVMLRVEQVLCVDCHVVLHHHAPTQQPTHRFYLHSLLALV